MLNAPLSLLPSAIVTPTETKSCDLPARAITTTNPLINISSQPALNAGGDVVAFWSTGNLDPRGQNPDGSIELYAAQLQSAGPAVITQVTNSSGSILGGFNLWPSLSANGTKIAFASDRDLTGQNPEVNFEVFVAQMGPGRAVTLTQISSTPAGVSLVPSLSADGNHVAFASDGNYANANNDRSLEIFIANLAGAQVVSYTQVTSAPAAILYDQPSISDDGQRMAFVQREFSDVTDVVSQTVMAWLGGSGPSSILTLDTTATDPRPAISGNGRTVAYVHSHGTDGPFELWVYNLTTSVTNSVASVVRECKPFISRNGDRVGCVNSDSVIAVYSPFRSVVTTGGTVGNNAQPVLASAGDTVAYVDSNDTISWITCRSADLALVLPVSNSVPARAGSLVTMSVPVSNLGPSASPTTTLFYTFTSTNDETIFVAGKPPATTVTGSVTHVGNIPANSVFTFTLPLSTTEGTQIEMDWRVEGASDDTNPTNNAITNTITMQSDVRFSIALSVTSSPTINVRAGSEITYAVVLRNIGVSRATGVIITDVLPAETTFIDVTSLTTPTRNVNCTTGLSVACEVSGTLPSQGVVTLTLRALVTDTALGPLTNVVSATANENFNALTKTLTTTVLPQADLQISSVVSPARPVAGEFATYTLFITNTGRVTVTNVVVTNTFPKGAIYDPLLNPAWSAPDGNLISSTVGSMPPAPSTRQLTYTIYISPEVKMDEVLTVTAGITSPQLANASIAFDPVISNNTAVHTATVQRVSDLSVSLDASPTVIAGQQITYVVVFTNAGPSDASLVTVTVSAPLLSPTQVSMTASLGVGMTGTAEFTATVGGSYITPTLVSTAIITSVNGDNNLSDNSFDFTSEVTSSADISAQITSALTSVTAGNRITYTVAFSNPGPSDAVNFVAVFSATGSVSFTAPLSWTKVNDRQISLSLPALASGALQTHTITGVVPSFAVPGSVIETRLSVSSDTPDPVLTNNVAVDVHCGGRAGRPARGGHPDGDCNCRRAIHLHGGLQQHRSLQRDQHTGSVHHAS